MYDTTCEIDLDLNTDEYFRCITGPKCVSSKMIRLTPGVTYQIDVDLKSIGEINSYVLLFVDCFTSDQDNSCITSEQVNYKENSGTIIESFTNDKIYIMPNPNVFINWNDASKTISQRKIGFYFDGNVEKKSDVVFSSYQSIDNNCLTLAEDLPKSITDQIVLNRTVIRNHCGSEPYIYPFYGLIGKEWIHISKTISGINRECHDVPNKFRKNTNFFKIGMLVQYGQDDKSTLAFKNFKISTLLEKSDLKK
jgi:hypothetical protein